MSRRARIIGIVVLCLAAAARADDTPAPPANSAAPAPAGDAAAAVPQIGRSIFIANDVDGKAGEAPAKRVAVNDDVMFQEDITTGSDAKAVIEFRDGSTFEIGPDAAVRIDSFIFNPEESTSQKALQVTRGVFRYVSAYVATEQNTTIVTPSGQIGIRGSLAEGVVDPAVPDFIYLGEGSATFTNSAGSAALTPGNSIAVPSGATAPMAPGSMPEPVAAQALQAIETRLPPRSAIANRPPADDAWLKRAGAADLVPVAEQRRIEAGAPARPLPAATGRGALAGELGLLAEGNRLNLFDGRQTARNPEQTAFLARAARDNPNAGATLRRFNAESGAMHRAAMTVGTAFVLRGVGRAASSAEVMRRVTAASVRANPGAAAEINRHAGDSYRGPARAEPKRPVQQPNDFERRQQGGNTQNPRAPRVQNAPPKQPPAKQPAKQPPKPQKPPPKQPPKKGNEKDRDQR